MNIGTIKNVQIIFLCLSSISLHVFSYTPKNKAPPIIMNTTLGRKPANNLKLKYNIILIIITKCLQDL